MWSQSVSVFDPYAAIVDNSLRVDTSDSRELKEKENQ